MRTSLIDREHAHHPPTWPPMDLDALVQAFISGHDQAETPQRVARGRPVPKALSIGQYDCRDLSQNANTLPSHHLSLLEIRSGQTSLLGLVESLG